VSCWQPPRDDGEAKDAIMLLGQLSANQIPYDTIDWLQIAIYFLALPIVALIGAAIGLVGRTRRGGMLWAINVGLLGGAVACLTLTLPLRQMGSDPFDDLFSIYQDTYRWQMLAAALASTFFAALVAAVAWRFLHKPADTRTASFSLKHLLIVQCLCVISLGCFVSLRQAVIEASNPHKRLVDYWRAKNWQLSDDQLAISPSPDLGGDEEFREALRTTNFVDMMTTLPSLRQVQLPINGKWNVDIHPLFQHQGLRRLLLLAVAPKADLLSGFENSQIEELFLGEEVSQVDFGPLCQSESLENLHLFGGLRRSNVESLKNAPSLRALSISDAKFAKRDLPILSWPQAISELHVGRTNLEDRDFHSLLNHTNLHTLAITDCRLNEETVRSILKNSKLQVVRLTLFSPSDEIFEQLATNPSRQIYLDLRLPELTPEDFGKLTRLPGLDGLDLTHTPCGDEMLAELSKLRTLKQLTISNPGVSRESLLELAKIETLERLGYPQSLSNTQFENDVHSLRKTLNLPQLQIWKVPPPKATTTAANP
jgi:hypothetical protein